MDNSPLSAGTLIHSIYLNERSSFDAVRVSAHNNRFQSAPGPQGLMAAEANVGGL
jgi:hypothetical protein